MRTYYEELYHYGVKGMKWGVINEEEKTSENQNKKQITEEELDELSKKSEKSYEAMYDYWMKSESREKLLRESAQLEYEHSRIRKAKSFEEQLKYTREHWDNDDGDPILNYEADDMYTLVSDDKLYELMKQQEEDEENWSNALYEYNKDKRALENAKEKAIKGKAATAGLLTSIGTFAVGTLGLYIYNRKRKRTVLSVKKGKQFLATLGVVSATAGIIAGASVEKHERNKKENDYDK